MDVVTDSYSNKVKSLGRFFAQTEKGAYTFAVADDELLQQNINQNLLQLAANENNKLAVVNIKQLATKDKAPIAALRHYLKEQKDIDGLIITNLYGLLISKEYPDFLTQLNFVREALLKLNLPILFWINHEMIPLLSRQAKDLYAQRHNFNLYFTETANRSNELQADQYIAIERSKAVPNKQQYESRLKLLFKQLEKAVAGGEDKVDIANDIVIEILDVYRQLPLMSSAFLRLFEEYEPYFDKNDAKSSFIIAYGLQQADKLKKAASFYEVSLELYRSLAKVNQSIYLPDVSKTLNNLGILQRDKNEFDKAEKSLLEALEIYRKLAEINLQSYLPNEAGILNNLGILQSNKNEFDKAEQAYKEALLILRKLAKANPQSYLRDVAGSLNNLGILQKNKNEFAKAEKSYLEALEIRQQFAKTNPSAFEIDLADTFMSLSQFFRYDKPSPSQSLQYAKNAATLYRKYAATVPHAKKWLQKAEANIKHWEEQHKS